MFYSIQALRALAAVLVVVTHSGYAYEAWMRTIKIETNVLPWANTHVFGVAGVHLFFVISGFIMASQKPRDVFEFAAKRVVRIVPMYWLCTLLFVATGQPKGDITWLEIARSLFFVPGKNPLLEVGWTLTFEVFFYVAFGLLAVWLRLSHMVVVTVLAGLVAIEAATGVIGAYGAPIVLEFALGLVAFRLFRSKWMERIGPLLFIGGLALLFSTAIWFKPHGPQGWGVTLAWGLPSFLVVLGAVAWELRRPNLLHWKPLMAVGGASYSLYLTHTMFFFGTWNLASMFFVRVPFMRFVEPHLATALFVGLLTIIAVVVSNFIEGPLNSAVRSAIFRRRISKPAEAY